MRPTVSKPSEAVQNVLRFSSELNAKPALQARLGQIHAWYAFRQKDGVWLFGPSKFVGYPNNTAEEYLRTAREEADGRQTEKALGQWFARVDPASGLGRTLMGALRNFLAQWNRVPRSDARISVISEQPGTIAGAREQIDEMLFSLIASDPEICGGRPCIKGTRMRVSDIVGMMAHGATASEIVADYPYLSEDDIHAALFYAARTADHRVIRAA